MTATRIAMLAGTYGLVMILGALGFQYLGGIIPCEMCHWQRWAVIGAGVVGLCGWASIAYGGLSARNAPLFAALALLLIACSGAIGAWQAGVEWHLIPGPQSCTGTRFVFTGMENLNNEHVVRCDVPQWTLFGISLAGYNAICSLGAALLGAALLLRKKP